MKTVYPTDQVFHRWANQLDTDRISNGKHGNVSAIGTRVYSYRECIGIIADGRAILSSYRWSATTGKHQSLAARAANHLPRTYLPCAFPTDGNLQRLAQMAIEQARTTLKNIDHGNKARTINATMRAQYADYCTLLDFAAQHLPDQAPAARVETLADLRALRDGQLVQDKLARLNGQAGALKLSIDAARNVIKRELWHGIEHTIDRLRMLPDLAAQLAIDYNDAQLPAPDYLAKLPAQARKLLPKLEALQAARTVELLRIHADDVSAWRAGASDSLSHKLPPLLRVNGDRIETSWGASVPSSVAPMLWYWATTASSTGTPIAGNGARVGDYTLTSVNADGSLTVGCHSIAFTELEALARYFGYID